MSHTNVWRIIMIRHYAKQQLVYDVIFSWRIICYNRRRFTTPIFKVGRTCYGLFRALHVRKFRNILDNTKQSKSPVPRLYWYNHCYNHCYNLLYYFFFKVHVCITSGILLLDHGYRLVVRWFIMGRECLGVLGLYLHHRGNTPGKSIIAILQWRI